MAAKQHARIIAEGRRRILVRMEILSFPPEAEIAEGPIEADFEEELVPQAEYYFVQAQWVHPTPEQLQMFLQNEGAAMGISAARSIKNDRKDLDFRTLQKQGIARSDGEGPVKERVEAPAGHKL